MSERSLAAGTSRLREMSRRLVLDELARARPVSQADLVSRTGLSRATVASVVSELRAEGRLTASAPTGPVGRGRPPRLLQLAASTGVVAGVDLGHSHLAVCLGDLAGAVIAERRVAMDVDVSGTVALDRAATELQDMVASEGVGSPLMIAIGVPGPIDRTTGEMRSTPLLPGWTGIRPARELRDRLHIPVIAENDANLCAIGEHVHGVARGVSDLLYIKVSSGIGAGVIVDGRLYRGARGTAGEIGHVQVREDGALCRCGSRGCLETVSSAETARRLLSDLTGRDLAVADVLRIVREEDPAAVRLFTDMGTAIGRVIAAISANMDPALVVVGGQVVDDPGPLLDGISAAVKRYTQPYVAAQLRVVGGTLGARAALLGALALAARGAMA